MSFADFLFQKGNMADHNIDITNAPKITIQSTDEERAEALGFFKKKRTVQRIQFTKAMNACQRALSGPPSKEKEIEATYLLQKAKEILMTLRKIQDIILDCTEDPKEMDALDEQDAQLTMHQYK
jgi:UDP-N-acetyl-D-mannosaminuronate dehydrogenase